ncbi:MAG: Type II secretion system protein G precursor [bacterium ADurb.Bin374]|nr:MAG: Type II secretion system protein G precursor [bacterium ADurb.Bin374]
MRLYPCFIRGWTRGFTLIELLVVIAIIAILAGAALPYVQSYVLESKISKAKADLEEIGRAIAIYETREKGYTASDVSLLTGRYLNRSPIDPWGRPFIVATHAGTVYSSGPDRNPATQDDNVFYMYQPLLALVRARWVDANQTGRVDAQNTPDYLLLTFSRVINDKAPGANVKSPLNFSFSSIPDEQIEELFAWDDVATMPDGKGLVVPLATSASMIFTPGNDTVAVRSENTLFDTSIFQRNRCISSQPVIIKAE